MRPNDIPFFFFRNSATRYPICDLHLQIRRLDGWFGSMTELLDFLQRVDEALTSTSLVHMILHCKPIKSTRLSICRAVNTKNLITSFFDSCRDSCNENFTSPFDSMWALQYLMSYPLGLEIVEVLMIIQHLICKSVSSIWVGLYLDISQKLKTIALIILANFFTTSTLRNVISPQAHSKILRQVNDTGSNMDVRKDCWQIRKMKCRSISIWRSTTMMIWLYLASFHLPTYIRYAEPHSTRSPPLTYKTIIALPTRSPSYFAKWKISSSHQIPS